MKNHGVTINDLTVSAGGTTMYFSTNGGKITYSLYKPTSAAKTGYADLSITKTVGTGKKGVVEAKVRFND